jgi:hypothetical protein
VKFRNQSDEVFPLDPIGSLQVYALHELEEHERLPVGLAHESPPRFANRTRARKPALLQEANQVDLEQN